MTKEDKTLALSVTNSLAHLFTLCLSISLSLSVSPSHSQAHSHPLGLTQMRPDVDKICSYGNARSD